MTAPLKVDPEVLQAAGDAFGQAGDGLSGLKPDAPLSSAAAGVPQLATAAACQAAQASVSAETTAAADAARQFGDSLAAAAEQYVGRDQDSARAVQAVRIPN